jgi:thymidine kinase
MKASKRILSNALNLARRRRLIKHGSGVLREGGHLTVIYGPMFAGKTSRIIQEVRRIQDVGGKVQCFRPLRDTRNREPALVNHNGEMIPAVLYDTVDTLKRVISKKTRLVVFDEINMTPPGFKEYCLELVSQGYRVAVSGLAYDYRGEEFPPTLELAKHADRVVELFAKCACGRDAKYTKRLVEVEGLIAPGGSDMYSPVCEECFYT